MTHTIRIYSANRFGEKEWEQWLESSTKSGVVRKANAIVRSCGVELTDIDKLTISKRHESWKLGTK